MFGLKTIDALTALRFALAFIAAFGLYYSNYLFELLGPLRVLADTQFAINAIRELTVHLLVSFVAAVVLLGIVRANVGSPEKFCAKSICYFNRSADIRSVYRMLIRFRSELANLYISVVTSFILYMSFTASIFYFFQFWVFLLFCLGLAISAGALFFGGKKPYMHRFIEKKNGEFLFYNIFGLLFLCFVSFGISSGRAERIMSGEMSYFVQAGTSIEGVLLGATSTGIFVRTSDAPETVSFFPYSQFTNLSSRAVSK